MKPMKIAVFSPLHPLKSGISDYTEVMLPALQKHFEIDLYFDPRYAPTNPFLRSEFKLFPFDPASFESSDYEAIVYHMGNYYPAHHFVYEALKKFPGIVILHDFVLQGFYARRYEVEGHFEEYQGLQAKYYGEKGREIAQTVAERITTPVWETDEALEFPLNEEILELATAVIVHSDFVKKRIQERAAKPVGKINHYAPLLRSFVREIGRSEWGVGDGHILISSCGFVNRNKRYDLIVSAIEELNDPRIVYMIAGEDRGGLLKDCLEAARSRIRVQGYLSLEKMESLIAASDLCINLRYPTMGESSGSLLRQLGYGKATVVTNCGSYMEFPDYSVLKVDPDIDERAMVTRVLAALVEDQDFRLSVGREGALFVQDECNLDKCAREYAAFIRAHSRSSP
jgi:glycosyltransferase involved in cell wall biosynthesis